MAHPVTRPLNPSSASGEGTPADAQDPRGVTFGERQGLAHGPASGNDEVTVRSSAGAPS